MKITKVLLVTLILSNIAILAGCAQNTEPAPTISQDMLQSLISGNVTQTSEEASVSQKEEPKETENNITIESSQVLESVTKENLYNISGYQKSTVNNTTKLSLSLTNIATEEEHTVDVSNIRITSHITEYQEEVQLQVDFDNDGNIQHYTILDKFTKEDLTNLSDDEFVAHFDIESKYEKVEMGVVPSTINISEYELNKIYIFDIPLDENGYATAPEIINDTNINVISVQQKQFGEFDKENLFYNSQYSRTFILNKSIKNSFSFSTTSAEKLYIMFSESNQEAFLSTEKCILASEWIGQEKVEYEFEDYIINDTNKIITINATNVFFGEEISATEQLAPNEIIACGWMNDHVTIT